MTMPTQPTPNFSEQLARLDERLANVAADVTETRSAINQILAQQSAFVANYESRHATLKSQVQNHEDRIVKIEKQVKDGDQSLEDFKQALGPFIFQSKMIAWIASALMVLLIGLVWAVLTHQVTLLYK